MALSELHLLFRRCLHRRVGASDFREILKRQRLNKAIKSREVVSIYISCCLRFCVEGDPLLPAYLQEILVSGSAKLIDFVTALVLQCKALQALTDGQIRSKTVSVQSRVVADLNVILTVTPTLVIDHLHECITLTAKWLTAMIKWSTADQLKDSVNLHGLVEVIGMLLVSQLNFNTTTRAPEMYEAVQQALDTCMNTLPSVSMELMNRLGTMQKPVHDDAISVEPHMMEMAAIQFEEGIMQSAMVATRATTTVFLQHLLSTTSTIDESVVCSFLSLRYEANHVVMFNDLVFAAMDAMLKLPQNQLYQEQCQLFILNKLPSILALIVTSSFESFSTEQSLLDGWNYVNTANPELAPRRLLQICSFHHLLPTETVSNVVGEDASLKGLYAKDDLVAQVTANHARGPRLIDELLKNDGNVGVISQAIFEIMTNYCHMKETQHLKDMANTIVRKPSSINAIGMFIKPSLFLASFCTLLDDWRWDDIHGESQPIYDEFGIIFLLIFAFKQRLQLTDSDLGVQQNGFLAKYLGSKNTELKMTDVVQKHVGDWIKSLYIDEGLSDELTTSCSAQDFYMLVPALLRESITAFTKGKLTYESLKAGLEYLLEPFLLPSLLPAFGWIQHIAPVEPKTAQLITQILVKAPENEARDTHQTILAMVSDQLGTDFLPKLSFTIEPPPSNLTQITTETYVSLRDAVRENGPLQVIHMLVSTLLQGNFPTLLDFIAMMVVTNDLQPAVQVMHGKIGHFLKRGENLFAEAVVHLSRRVGEYATTLATQDLIAEPFVPMNVANVNLDAVPEVFQQPEQNEDIDQVLNEAAAMGMDQLDSANLDDMYGLDTNDFGLGSMDDLDLGMFE